MKEVIITYTNMIEFVDKQDIISVLRYILDESLSPSSSSFSSISFPGISSPAVKDGETRVSKPISVSSEK